MKYNRTIIEDRHWKEEVPPIALDALYKDASNL